MWERAYTFRLRWCARTRTFPMADLKVGEYIFVRIYRNILNNVAWENIFWTNPSARGERTRKFSLKRLLGVQQNVEGNVNLSSNLITESSSAWMNSKQSEKRTCVELNFGRVPHGLRSVFESLCSPVILWFCVQTWAPSSDANGNSGLYHNQYELVRMSVLRRICIVRGVSQFGGNSRC